MNPGPTPRPQERFKIQEGFKVQDRNISGKCLNLLLKNYHATTFEINKQASSDSVLSKLLKLWTQGQYLGPNRGSKFNKERCGENV